MVYRLVAKDAIENKVMDDGLFESAALTAADIQDLLS